MGPMFNGFGHGFICDEVVCFEMDEWCFVEARRPNFMSRKCVRKGLMEGGERSSKTMEKKGHGRVGSSQQ